MHVYAQHVKQPFYIFRNQQCSLFLQYVDASNSGSRGRPLKVRLEIMDSGQKSLKVSAETERGVPCPILSCNGFQPSTNYGVRCRCENRDLLMQVVADPEFD